MYDEKLYKGDYLARQRKANADNCVAYVEHHFNSSTNPSAQYTCVIVGSNASQTSRNWGRWYARAVANEFGIPVGGDQGIVVGGFDGRGDGNLRHTKMPAILLEPLFASNPQQAEWIRSEAGQNRLARILTESIQRFFQDGGLIGFSIGHKYKDSNPNDRGADVFGGGTEADFAELVIEKSANMLKTVTQPQTERQIRVMQGDNILWQQAVDEDANITWDPVRGVLRLGDV